MALHFLSADRRIGLADTGEEQAQVFVDLCSGSYSGARIARDDFLLDGNSWRQAFDEITFGFAHSAQELAGIAWQWLYIATLAFGIKSVESQWRLARARYACYGNKLALRNLDVDILQVVGPGSFDLNIFFFSHLVTFFISSFFTFLPFYFFTFLPFYLFTFIHDDMAHLL